MKTFKTGWMVLAIIALALGGCSEAMADNAEDTTGDITASTTGATSTGKFLHLSDIHFDPTVDGVGLKLAQEKDVSKWKGILEAAGADKAEMSHNQRFGSQTDRRDSNYALVLSALDEAKKQGPYDFIVYTGDYLPHFFRGAAPSDSDERIAFKANTIAFINGMIAERFGDTPLIAALGNNDAGDGDYNLKQNSPFLADVADDIPVVAASSAATKSFEEGGNYLVSPPGLPFDFLVLSVFWSHEYPGQTRDCGGHSGQAGRDQMTFFRNAISGRDGSDRPIMLVMHIPPGMDGFKSQETGSARHQWCGDFNYLTDFMGDASTNKSVFAMGFAGHTHMDSFRVMNDGSSPYLPIRIGPAVTTWNGNAPAFTVFDYDSTNGTVTDFSVFTLTNVGSGIPPSQANWSREYRFGKEYGSGGFTAAKIDALAQSIQTGRGTSYDAFNAYYKARPGTLNNWSYYACAIDEFGDKPFRDCAKAN